eukprot:CAMPEP_0116561186 /NCGR_PEP_ID=MMETSP0397-20121206/11435_1 /TAXON_ID=216820 /ORGANISM="Cyclophora tenuis, Strain ECT3854" /LENGTH=114 /DNA_ID=CAMNT_0004087285 /DNA_START=91 /DNA_END=435 /DNA_ORIENTATION=-
MASGTISRDECVILTEILGSKTPAGCGVLAQTDGKDPFTYPNDNPFRGQDEKLHRNSWLMPRLARRLTKNCDYHVSKWHKPLVVDSAECAKIRKALEEKIGTLEAKSKLPEACK